MDKVYKLYGAGNANANDLAHLDVQEDTLLMAIFYHVVATSGTLSGSIRTAFELSFTSVNQYASNDTRLALASAGVSLIQSTAAGFAEASKSGQIDFMSGIDVPLGQRIYLHQVDTNGTISAACTMYLYTHTHSGRARRRPSISGGVTLPGVFGRK